MLKTLSKSKKIDNLVRRNVISVLREVLVDSEAGLELTTGAAARLKKSIRSREAGRVKTLDQILAKYR